MINIYDTANQLEREIRQTEQFKALEQAVKALKENKASYDLFKEFQSFQQSMQQKMMAGEELSDADAHKAEDLTTKMQGDSLVSDVMMKEQAFSQLINELNRIVLKPVNDLYQ